MSRGFDTQRSEHKGCMSRGFGTQRFEHKGWMLEAETSRISRDADVEAVKERIGAASMPEQLFGDSHLRLTHTSSGVAIDFNAADALAAWQGANLPPVQVAIASQWQSDRKGALEKVAALKYDWTFTTPYAGTLRQADSNAAASDTSGPAARAATAAVNSNTASADTTPAADAGGRAAEHSAAGWQPSTEQPDMALLTARDPILFFVEVPLFESELDDNGTSQLSVKVRVMPNCWYVLLRFFLRVDRTLVRLREVRTFCDLRRPERIVREIKHAEATLEQLSGGAAAGRGVAHADADGAALALSAIAPNGVKMFRTEALLL